MKTYNGFSSEQRAKSLVWFKKQVAEGKRVKHTVCEVCGQTNHIQDHDEDYSEPFGDHIGKYGLCYFCHQVVHLRDRFPKGWEYFKQKISDGAIFEPVDNIGSVMSFMRRPEKLSFKSGPPRGKTFLDRLK